MLRSSANAQGAEVLTDRGLAIGTPAYMSPEQASGERTVDARTDIYSLACVLYENARRPTAVPGRHGAGATRETGH